MINRVAERIRVGLEDAEMLANIDQAQLDTMAQAIMDAKRVYIAGWGRAGNCIKILAMDCSQMGMEAHICGDNTTPSIHEGDILIIGSGSGNTNSGSTGSGADVKKGVQSSKTGDAGVALYAAMSLLSLTGGAVVLGRKRKAD